MESANEGTIALFLRLQVRPFRDLVQQALERRQEVGFIEHDEGVGAQQACVVGSHLSANAVALEQQARADHVDGPDDDGRRRRVLEPFPLVHMLAAERADAQGGIARFVFD